MKAREVIEIFEDFEEEVKDEDLTDLEKVKGVLKDVDDRKVRSLWKSFDGYDERDYMMFKGSVLEYYLGMKKTTKYFLKQLEELSDRNQSQQITLRQLTNFYSCFSLIVLWLEDEEIISTSETNEYFWYGLPKKIQKSITQELGLGKTIPLMKQAFKEASHTIEAMLEEEEEDSYFFGWPSIMEPASAVGFLTKQEPSDDNARIEQELQEFEDSEEDVVWSGKLGEKEGAMETVIGVELQDLQNNDDAQRQLECLDEAVERMENSEPEELQGLDDKEEEILATYNIAVKDLPAPIEKVVLAIGNGPPAIEDGPPAIKNELAAFEEALASNEDMLETNVDIAAEYNEPPLYEGIPIDHKSPLASDRPPLKVLSVPWKLQDSHTNCVLPLSSVYGPAHCIFTHRKVRKKLYYSKTAK